MSNGKRFDARKRARKLGLRVLDRDRQLDLLAARDPMELAREQAAVAVQLARLDEEEISEVREFLARRFGVGA